MIEVREGRLGKSVYATQPFSRGQVVLRGWGHPVPHRTRHSLQVDLDTHMRFPSELELLKHSCEPNCWVSLRRGSQVAEIVAMRDIEPGEELTLDYALFEYEITFMNGPCLCGTPSCRGRITGYQDLPPELRASNAPYLAEYLHELEAQVSRAG